MIKKIVKKIISIATLLFIIVFIFLLPFIIVFIIIKILFTGKDNTDFIENTMDLIDNFTKEIDNW